MRVWGWELKRGCSFWVGVRGRIQVPPVPPDKPVWLPPPRLPGEVLSQAAAWLGYLPEYLSTYQTDLGRWEADESTGLTLPSPPWALTAAPCPPFCSWQGAAELVHPEVPTAALRTGRAFHDDSPVGSSHCAPQALGHLRLHQPLPAL